MNELAILKAVSTYVGMYYRFPYDETCSLALRDSLSRGQLFSKLELLNLARNCIKKPRQALFIGHWHGLLPRLFYTHGLIDTAHGVELDDRFAPPTHGHGAICLGTRCQTQCGAHHDGDLALAGTFVR